MASVIASDRLAFQDVFALHLADPQQDGGDHPTDRAREVELLGDANDADAGTGRSPPLLPLRGQLYHFLAARAP